MTHIYTGDDSRSHFREIDVRLSPLETAAISARFSATGIQFRHRLPQYSGKRVNAPCRQFVVILYGNVELELADGVTRTFDRGDAGFIEDTFGEGHISKVLYETVQLDIPVGPGFHIEDLLV